MTGSPLELGMVGKRCESTPCQLLEWGLAGLYSSEIGVRVWASESVGMAGLLTTEMTGDEAPCI